MTGQQAIKKRIETAYQDLIDREGSPDPKEIREKIYDIGHERVVSIIYLRERENNKKIAISTGQMGRFYINSLVFYLHPSGYVKKIHSKDIIDIIDPIFNLDKNWPFPKEFFYDPE